jgi:hypothetical protein
MAFLSGVHFSYQFTHFKFRPNTAGLADQCRALGTMPIFTMDSVVLGLASSGCGCCTAHVFRLSFAPKDSIDFINACSPITLLYAMACLSSVCTLLRLATLISCMRVMQWHVFQVCMLLRLATLIYVQTLKVPPWKCTTSTSSVHRSFVV